MAGSKNCVCVDVCMRVCLHTTLYVGVSVPEAINN